MGSRFNLFLRPLLVTFSPSCLSQASNGNDPWSVWNADPSGGSNNNNWASNPEGTQTGKSAADPWGSISQGHPQAYQGPGRKKALQLSTVVNVENMNSKVKQVPVLCLENVSLICGHICATIQVLV